MEDNQVKIVSPRRKISTIILYLVLFAAIIAICGVLVGLMYKGFFLSLNSLQFVTQPSKSTNTILSVLGIGSMLILLLYGLVVVAIKLLKQTIFTIKSLR